MKIESAIYEGVAIVRISGRLWDPSDVATIGKVVEALMSAGFRFMVFDLDKLESVTSTGMSAIVGAFTRIQMRSGKLIFINLHGSFRQVLEITRLKSIFTEADNLQSALAMIGIESEVKEGELKFAEGLGALGVDASVAPASGSGGGPAAMAGTTAGTTAGARPDGTGGAQLVRPPEVKPHEHVFISYSSKDKSVADAVCATLEAQGVRCWIAPRDVMPGRDYASALMDGLHESCLMVLVFSSGANQSPQVLREVERAVSRGMPILPFRIEEVKPSESMEYFIASRHWLDALTPPLAQHLARLADTVKMLIGAVSGT